MKIAQAMGPARSDIALVTALRSLRKVIFRRVRTMNGQSVISCFTPSASLAFVRVNDKFAILM